MVTNLKKSLLLAAALVVASGSVRASDNEGTPVEASRFALLKTVPMCAAAYAWKGLSDDAKDCNTVVYCDRVVRLVGLFTVAGLVYKYAPVAYAKAKKMMTGEQMTAKRA